jgi:glycine/D-amino acid oxidase-like deaminating enzyme/nitrite reductase/ring-hydroxylating ferredoxin subunit
MANGHDTPERLADLPGEGRSLWLATTPETGYPPLEDGLEVDTVVIGGGICGLLIAFRLMEAGQKVALVESGRLASSTTGHTTAKITALHGLVYARLLRTLGREKAGLYAHANHAALNRFREIVSSRGIDCDFTASDAVTYIRQGDDPRPLEDEVKAADRVRMVLAWQEDTGLPFPAGPGVRLPGQARFHPRKFLLEIARILGEGGARIFENTRALDVSSGKRVSVTTSRGRIRAGHVVLATSLPFLSSAPYVTRMRYLGSHVLAARVPGEMPEGMYYQAGPELRSLRLQPGSDGRPLVLVGGEKHPAGHVAESAEHYRRLAAWARERLGATEITHRWYTHDNFSVDHVPYIGRLRPDWENVFLATGFSGWGMSQSMIASMVLGDKIIGEPSPYKELYSPSRLGLSGAGESLKANIHVARMFVSDHVAPKEVEPADLAPGQGGIIRSGARKTGVRKDAGGHLHAVSASCTHWGCVLSWNEAEQSWDCPCHGSRFDARGKVIHGPAVKDLDEKSPPEE